MRNAGSIEMGAGDGQTAAMSGATGRNAQSAGHFSSLVPLSFLLLIISMTLLLSSCGAKSGQFRIEGRFVNFNQGEFYVYSPDGGLAGIDTIKVFDGRFAYETPLPDKATFILVFPNFSEQAVFGQSGATVTIGGDASHLKEMEITGTKDNKLMTEFRMRANRMSPPEIVDEVAAFVEDNPTSPASMYLVNKYLVQTVQPDYGRACKLVGTLLKADSENGRLAIFLKQLETLKASDVGNAIPAFSATDTEGKRVGRNALNGKVNVVCAWASWNFDSQSMQRRLRALRKDYGRDLAVVSVCLDARKEDCRRWTASDSVDWPNVCDGRMWDTPMLRQLGIATVPGVILADRNGKIIARNLNGQQMTDKIESILKK